jgi:hypothetical protein
MSDASTIKSQAKGTGAISLDSDAGKANEKAKETQAEQGKEVEYIEEKKAREELCAVRRQMWASGG